MMNLLGQEITADDITEDPSSTPTNDLPAFPCASAATGSPLRSSYVSSTSAATAGAGKPTQSSWASTVLSSSEGW